MTNNKDLSTSCAEVYLHYNPLCFCQIKGYNAQRYF